MTELTATSRADERRMRSEMPSDNITVVQDGDLATLHLPPGQKSVRFQGLIADLLASGVRRLNVDLRVVSYLDSMGLGELVRCHLMVKKAKGELQFIHVSDTILSLLNVTKLSLLLTVSPQGAASV